eukprot:SAG31_NODE_1696_length_7503_cov_45.737574_4_plen_206_part_00
MQNQTTDAIFVESVERLTAQAATNGDRPFISGMVGFAPIDLTKTLAVARCPAQQAAKNGVTPCSAQWPEPGAHERRRLLIPAESCPSLCSSLATRRRSPATHAAKNGSSLPARRRLSLIGRHVGRCCGRGCAALAAPDRLLNLVLNILNSVALELDLAPHLRRPWRCSDSTSAADAIRASRSRGARRTTRQRMSLRCRDRRYRAG